MSVATIPTVGQDQVKPRELQPGMMAIGTGTRVPSGIAGLGSLLRLA